MVNETNQIIFFTGVLLPWVYLPTTVLNVPGNALNSGLNDLTLGLKTNLKVYKTSGELALCKRGVLNI